MICVATSLDDKSIELHALHFDISEETSRMLSWWNLDTLSFCRDSEIFQLHLYGFSVFVQHGSVEICMGAHRIDVFPLYSICNLRRPCNRVIDSGNSVIYANGWDSIAIKIHKDQDSIPDSPPSGAPSDLSDIQSTRVWKRAMGPKQCDKVEASLFVDNILNA